MILDKELSESKKTINKVIKNCEKMLIKFKPETSQHTLLVNRISALKLILCLMDETCKLNITQKELDIALIPIESIIHKTTKAQSKYEIGSKQYKRYLSLLNAMKLSKALIEEHQI